MSHLTRAGHGIKFPNQFACPDIESAHSSARSSRRILLQPRSCYDEGKRCAETLFFDYNRQDKVDIRVVRIFNTYGPRMRIKDARQTFLGTWIDALIKGKPFEVWGGEQLRDFTYVDDTVEALMAAP